jgi:hypothetical protein
MPHPFVVRKVSSGYTGRESFIVVKNPGARRVSVHASVTRETAQVEADTLNIGAMVKNYDEDPRPYAERLAEAEAAYRASQED